MLSSIKKRPFTILNNIEEFFKKKLVLHGQGIVQLPKKKI